MKSIENRNENCNKNGAIKEKERKKRGRRVTNYAQGTAVQRAMKVRDATNKTVKEVQEKRRIWKTALAFENIKP